MGEWGWGMATTGGEGDAGRIRVLLSKEFADLAPGYVQRRVADAIAIAAALGEGRLEVVRVLAHRMRGTGAGYGLEFVSRAGTAIELAVARGDHDAAMDWTIRLSDYLDRVEVIETAEDVSLGGARA